MVVTAGLGESAARSSTGTSFGVDGAGRRFWSLALEGHPHFLPGLLLLHKPEAAHPSHGLSYECKPPNLSSDRERPGHCVSKSVHWDDRLLLRA